LSPGENRKNSSGRTIWHTSNGPRAFNGLFESLQLLITLPLHLPKHLPLMLVYALPLESRKLHKNWLPKGEEPCWVRWDPFREFELLPKRFGGFFGKEPEMPAPITAWNPSVDIFENANEIVIKAELPGMAAKDIEVSLANNVLLIKGERKFEREAKEENYHRMEREYGAFGRSFALPAAVNENDIAAEYKDGVLKVVLPKEADTKPKPIKIAAA
jgi:HSP20 family protein